MQARIALAIIGLLVWGYGAATDAANYRLVGIILLALSLILRFVGRHPRPSDPAV